MRDLRTWFKGADTTSVLLWLEAVFSCLNEETFSTYTKAIEVAIHASNSFLRLLYRGGLWLTNVQAKTAIRHGRTFCRAYLDAAMEAHQAQRLRFKISPKFHAFSHLTFDMWLQIRNEWVLSPLLSCCQQDEDFVGKVCSLSVQGCFKLVHLHTVQRYLLNLHEHW